MNPANIGCLSAAGVNCCVLANNHVLDFGRAGLSETLESLSTAGISSAGAGHSPTEAQAAAMLPAGSGRRVAVFAFGCTNSGIPSDWAAEG